MPRILGMEPEQYKPLLLVGGGAAVLFLYLRSRGQSQQAPPLLTAPPTDSGPVGTAPSVGAVQDDYSFSRDATQALQYQAASQQLSFQKASQDLALQVQTHQADLYNAQLQRQTDIQKHAPVSCPHGSEVRLDPSGTPYCRSSKGAVTFGNLAGAVGEGVQQALPGIVTGAINYETGKLPWNVSPTRSPGQPTGGVIQL